MASTDCQELTDRCKTDGSMAYYCAKTCRFCWVNVGIYPWFDQGCLSKLGINTWFDICWHIAANWSRANPTTPRMGIKDTEGRLGWPLEEYTSMPVRIQIILEIWQLPLLWSCTYKKRLRKHVVKNLQLSACFVTSMSSGHYVFHTAVFAVIGLC